MKQVKFSFVVPTYNRAHLIAATVKSLLGQNYDNFEVIVVDDGSTDNTEEVIRDLSDERVVYYRKENAERGAARNFGANKASGEYINFFDSDDLAYPNHLAEANRMVGLHNHPEIFYLAFEWMDGNGHVYQQVNDYSGSLNKKLLKGNILSCNGVFVKRDIALEYPFNQDRKLSATEDWELWLRLASRYTIHYSNTITTAIINHEGRSVVNFNEEALLERTHLLIKYLKQDEIFMREFGAKLPHILAHMYSYSALHLAMEYRAKRALNLLFKAIGINFQELHNRRTFAIFKYLILSVLNKSPRKRI